MAELLSFPAKRARMPPTPSRPVRLLPIISIFVLLAATFGTVGWLVYSRERSEEIASAGRTLTAIAQLKARQAENWLAERRGDARGKGQDPLVVREVAQLVGHPGRAPSPELLGSLRLTQAGHQYLSFVLVDRERRTRFVLGDAGEVDERGRDLVATALADCTIQTSGPHTGDAGGGARARIDVVGPVIGPDGRCDAALLMRIDAARFLFPVIDSWPVPSASAEAFLIRRDADTLIYLNALRHHHGGPMSLTADADGTNISSRALGGERGVLVGRDYRGVRVVGASDRVAGTDWLLIAKVDEREVLAPLRERAGWMGAALGLALVVSAFGVALVVSRRESRHYRDELRLQREGLAAQAEISRLNRLYEFRSAVNRAIARATSERALIEEVCQVAVDVGNMRLAWFGEVDPSTCGVNTVASAGPAEGYLDELVVSASDEVPEGRGPVGRALRSGAISISGDIATAELMGPWRARALAYGLRSCASVPVRAADGARAVLTMYAAEPDTFDETERRLLENIGEDLSFGLHHLRDAAERQRLEKEVRQSQRMEAIGRLAGGVAHDFNNLLTAIRGFAGLALEDTPRDDTRHAKLEQIDLAASRAADLTRQLLAFSRRQVLQPRAVDLNAAVAETTRMLRRVIGEHIAIVMDLAPALWSIDVDPGQIDQVLMNLAINARDAMPDGGTLRITTRNVVISPNTAGRIRAGEYVHLTIEDTGTGIPADILPHVFEPFFTTKAVGRGTGLGLSTVHGIVAQSGGHIDVRSTQGRGTIFEIHLPRTTGRVAPPGELPSSEPGPPRHATLLLVEDEPAVRELAQVSLERVGYRVIAAGSPEEAVRSFERAAQIDLLVTDVVMPVMSGPRLAAALRAVHPTLRVLYISGYADMPAEQGSMLPAGARLLPKPFTPGALVKAVGDALEEGVVRAGGFEPPTPAV